MSQICRDPATGLRARFREEAHRAADGCGPPVAGVTPNLGHAEGGEVKIEDFLLFLALALVQPPQRDNFSHDFWIEARALRLGIDVLDVVGDRLFSSSSFSMRSIKARRCPPSKALLFI